jgi:hypothetical protein
MMGFGHDSRAMGTVTWGGHNASAHDGWVCVLVFIGLLAFVVVWNSRRLSKFNVACRYALVMRLSILAALAATSRGEV